MKVLVEDVAEEENVDVNQLEPHERFLVPLKPIRKRLNEGFDFVKEFLTRQPELCPACGGEIAIKRKTADFTDQSTFYHSN